MLARDGMHLSHDILPGIRLIAVHMSGALRKLFFLGRASSTENSLLTRKLPLDILSGPQISQRTDRSLIFCQNGGATLPGQPSVLIIDESLETREVLRTALQRRGTQILEASRSSQALKLAKKHQPDVIVLDHEALDLESCENSHNFADMVHSWRIPLVVLGGVRSDARLLPNEEFVAKPYHYGPLIRRIEELLGKAA